MHSKSTKELKLSFVDVESIYDTCIVLDDDTEKKPFEVIEVCPLAQWSSLFVNMKEESEDESECFDFEQTKESSSQTSIDDFEDEGYNI